MAHLERTEWTQILAGIQRIKANSDSHPRIPSSRGHFLIDFFTARPWAKATDHYEMWGGSLCLALPGAQSPHSSPPSVTLSKVLSNPYTLRPYCQKRLNAKYVLESLISKQKLQPKGGTLELCNPRKSGSSGRRWGWGEGRGLRARPTRALGAERSFPKDRKPQPLVPGPEGGEWQGSLSRHRLL